MRRTHKSSLRSCNLFSSHSWSARFTHLAYTSRRITHMFSIENILYYPCQTTACVTWRWRLRISLYINQSQSCFYHTFFSISSLGAVIFENISSRFLVYLRFCAIKWRQERELQSWPNVVERKVQVSVVTFNLNNPPPPSPSQCCLGLFSARNKHHTISVSNARINIEKGGRGSSFFVKSVTIL
jgi:hypothetical protein